MNGRSKQSAKTGKNSTIYQIKDAYIMHPSNLPELSISHCGNCIDFCKQFPTTDNSIINEYSHCENVQNITTIDEYLSYNYHKMLNTYNEKYVKPTLLVSEGFAEFGSKTYEKYDGLSIILSKDYNSYMIVGEGGIGKSNFLSKLFFELIVTSLQNSSNIMPIWLRADYFGNKSVTPREWYEQTIVEKFRNLDFGRYINDPNYKIYIFIDGINGVQYTNQKDFESKLLEWSKFIEEYTDQHSNVNFILSSRDISAIECFSSQKQRKVYIQHLEEYKAKEFVRLFADSDDQIKYCEEVLNQHKGLPFIFIPYFLRKIIESPQRNITIENKTDIVLLYISYIFENYKNTAPSRLKKMRSYGSKKLYDLKCDNYYFFEVMFELAFLCQSNNKKVISREDIDDLYSSDNTIQDIIDVAVNEEVLVQNRDAYSFGHTILQEFLAAMRINYINKGVYQSDTIIPFEDKTMSMEVLPHIYNLAESKKDFIELLIGSGNLLYAAECVKNSDESFKQIISESIVKRLKDNNLTLTERADLGFYLGEIGDIRFLKTNGYIEPPIVSVTGMSKVKIGCFPITNAEFELFIKDNGYTNTDYWDIGIRDGWFNYDRVFDVMIGFWYDIRRRFNLTPNSFIEFCRNELIDTEKCACLAWFLNMSDDDVRTMFLDLYNKEKYQKPLLWDNPNYNNPSQPVLGISYYEALAYCSWLSSKTGRNYRLLTEDEWETMARANTLKYIFGGRYSDKVCNTLECELKSVMPVGVIERNKTSEGIYDINGNIFEWTSSIYRKDTEPLNIQYVVKGGSWIQTKERATSKYIGRAKAWCRNADVGFRVCLDENN